MGCAPLFKMVYQIEPKRFVLLMMGFALSIFLVLQSSSSSSYLAWLPPSSLLPSIFSLNSPRVVQQSTLLHNSNSTNTSLIPGLVNTTATTTAEGIVKPNGKMKDNEQVPSQYNTVALGKSSNEDVLLNVSSKETGIVSQPFVTSATPIPTTLTPLHQTVADLNTTHVSNSPGVPSVRKESNGTFSKGKLSTESSTTNSATRGKRMPPATTISDMTRILFQNRISSHAMIPRWSSVRDQELLSAKSKIENAPALKSSQELDAFLYRNVSTFKRSYELMENTFKVYVYSEGDKPIFHQPKLKGIYASEGWFMKLMEGNKQFVVKDPAKAHMFYLPFSALTLRYTLNKYSMHHKNLSEFLKKYVSLIAGKYNFWNRTGGADHFLAACHDWAPQVTSKSMGTCIRALCNANVALGFELGKDVSLPVTYIPFENDTLRIPGGKRSSKRPFLAFFAGHMHGYVRPILLQYWKDKDPDMKIFGPLPRNAKPSYLQYMKSSKYCICARGYEVHTPRVVEAIFHGCVPVIIADNYVPPFFEILNWEAFSIFVLEKDIPNLKNILLSIPIKRYQEMQRNVGKVQKHFLWHKIPVKYDIFHMTLHSIWYNRVFQLKSS